LEQGIIKSPAWLSLVGVATHVYLLFRCKCQWSNRRRKPGGRDAWTITNNGELEFTYAEAKKKYGITKGQFVRALDQLIDRGFLDVAATGMGVFKAKTLYSISYRWQHWGTDAFDKAERPAASIRNCGFKPGNKIWEKSKAMPIHEHGQTEVGEPAEADLVEVSV
jgi:hypothetical protein